jgi:heme exporter protein D
MIWNSWSEFWSMGGRGYFVWMSVGVTFLVLALEIIISRRNHISLKTQLLEARAIEADEKQVRSSQL